MDSLGVLCLLYPLFSFFPMEFCITCYCAVGWRYDYRIISHYLCCKYYHEKIDFIFDCQYCSKCKLCLGLLGKNLDGWLYGFSRTAVRSKRQVTTSSQVIKIFKSNFWEDGNFKYRLSEENKPVNGILLKLGYSPVVFIDWFTTFGSFQCT